ncbi:hypothetical protein TA3x_001119 [Tundrisphaera sp. TA3]|uniref:hypothetical protein n=1 Tax=Tundrisphaera sp. TA3 TaxID=3435775 RepID=UPI003EBB7440
MQYSREMAIAFWYEYDNHFLFEASAEVRRAYRDMGGLDFPRMRWKEHRAQGTFPDGFQSDMVRIRFPLQLIANQQLEIIDRHFGGDFDNETLGFIDFGQGVLFDDRRDVGDKVHKMDIGGPDIPPIGYHRWYPIVRAISLVADNPDRWLQVARNIGLAWAIQSEARPEEDNPNNPGLPQERLSELRTEWQARSFDDLDAAFEHEPFPNS